MREAGTWQICGGLRKICGKFRYEMNEQQILEELLALLEANKVIIRTEPLGGTGGGLCTIRGQTIFFVDAQATSADMAATCAEAVAKVVDTEKVYIRPEVRQFIEEYTDREGQ